MAEQNLRNRTVSEIDESEHQANSLGEGGEVGVEAETSADETSRSCSNSVGKARWQHGT
jgi:hypothetical protein